MAKPVALILLNWNTPVHTANCIASVQQYCNADLYDIIVADNGSTDNSLAIIKAQYPQLIYIENKENLGFAEGNNRALEYSIAKDYEYSLLINTDTVVDEDIIANLKTHMDAHPEAASVQPVIYWMHDRNRIWNGRGCFNAVLGLTYTYNKLPPGNKPLTYSKAKWNSGCCMFLRNTALVKSGLLNNRFFLYYEDVELSYRLQDNGYEVHYLPSTKMYHEAGVSAKVEKAEGFVSPVIHYYISRNRIWFLRRYGSIWFYPVYIMGSLFYYGALWIYFKIRSRNEKARLLVKGVCDGLFTPAATIWP